MPEVTVLMAVYNGMPYLPKAVESICRQTFTDWRLLIINDRGGDESDEYLDGLDDPRVDVVHEEKQGLNAALNRGLSLCSTPFLARMDSDDVAHPARLEQQLAFLNANPEVGLVGSHIERMGPSRTAGNSRVATDHETILADLLEGKPALYHPAITCRTELLKEIGGYWQLSIGEEYDMFLRMGERAQLANLDQVLLSYRLHTGSITGAKLANVRLHIAYACKSARRRQNGLEAISFDDFARSQESRSLLHNTATAMELYARCQYRLAVAELLGSHRLRGYARLGWAALCSPQLTGQRVVREVRGRLGSRRAGWRC